MDKKDWRTFYETYGVEFSGKSNKHFKTDCVACGEAGKMFVNENDGRFVCKLCDVSGNHYEFIKLIHSQMSEKKDKLVVRLGKAKKINSNRLAEHGVVGDGTRVYIPRYGLKGSVVSLHPYDFKSNKVYNIKDQSPRPNFWRWNKRTSLTYVFESDLDGLCFLIQAEKKKLKCNIVSLPGASSMKEEWVKYFKGKNTVWCFDHDLLKGKREGHKFYPGLKGIQKACEVLDGATANFKWIDWEEGGYERPFDIRDLYIEHPHSSKFMGQIDLMTKDFEHEKAKTATDRIEPAKVESFEELVQHFMDAGIDVSQYFKVALACSCATILSATTEGDPIWLFLVAPASGGKTTILDGFSACYGMTIHRSTLTKTSLVSGKQMEDDDPSLMSKIDKKALIIKDLTMLLTMNQQAQEETFGLLRDAYDDEVHIPFGNGVTRHYKNLRFSWLAGVTDIIHRFNKSDAGERFLKVDLLDPESNEDKTIRSALMNLSDDSFKVKLKSACLGFINYMVEKGYEKLPNLTDRDVDRITALAQVISFMRTKTHKDPKTGTLEFRTRKEQGSRVAKQLGKLTQMLCVVFQKDQLDDNEFAEYINKVAIDTCTSIQTEVTYALMDCFQRFDFATSEMIANKLQLTKQAVGNHLNNMQEVGFAEFKRISNTSENRGASTKGWVPTDKFRKLWVDACLDKFDHPINRRLIEVAQKKKVKKKRRKSASTIRKTRSGSIRGR